MTLIQFVILMVILGTDILLALLYIVPIAINRRLYNLNNVFTVNLAFAIFACAISWLMVYFIPFASPAIYSTKATCILISYYQGMCTLQVPLAFVQGSIHRLLSIVYSRQNFIKNHLYASVVVALQWLIGYILAVPLIFPRSFTCFPWRWQRIYTLLVTVVIPSIVYATSNILIFKHVRSSSTRVQPSISTGKAPVSQPLSRRDLHLVRHMVVMFCVFVGGWSPIFIYSMIERPYDAGLSLFFVCESLSALSLACIVVNLFLYNRDLRQYWKERMITPCTTLFF